MYLVFILSSTYLLRRTVIDGAGGIFRLGRDKCETIFKHRTSTHVIVSVILSQWAKHAPRDVFNFLEVNNDYHLISLIYI